MINFNNLEIQKSPSVLVWIEFHFDGDDFYPITWSSIPEDHWLAQELSYSGWELILGAWPMPFEFYSQKWLSWAILHGIGLYQPFLLHLDPPEYYRCNSYFEPPEWDVNWSWKIICLTPAQDNQAMIEVLEDILNRDKLEVTKTVEFELVKNE